MGWNPVLARRGVTEGVSVTPSHDESFRDSVTEGGKHGTDRLSSGIHRPARRQRPGAGSPGRGGCRLCRGDGGTILRTYTEIETGKRADRPELANALADCKRSRATLVIAKLDRLARNARFLLALIESGVDVAFCDLPTVPPGAIGKFLLTQMAAVAELEARVDLRTHQSGFSGLQSPWRRARLGSACAHRLTGGANPKPPGGRGKWPRPGAEPPMPIWLP